MNLAMWLMLCIAVFVVSRMFCTWLKNQRKRKTVQFHILDDNQNIPSEVLEIENNSFEYPWTKEEFERCLRWRSIRGIVAKANSKVVGYMIYELRKNHTELLNFAIEKSYRRCGIGTKMIRMLMARVDAKQSVINAHITLRLRETNLIAQLFFRKMKFFAEVDKEGFDVTPGTPNEGAILMRYPKLGSLREQYIKNQLDILSLGETDAMIKEVELALVSPNTEIAHRIQREHLDALNTIYVLLTIRRCEEQFWYLHSQQRD